MLSWRDTAEVRHERQVAEYPDTGERPSCLNPKVSAEREGSDPSPSRRTAGARRHDKQVRVIGAMRLVCRAGGGAVAAPVVVGVSPVAALARCSVAVCVLVWVAPRAPEAAR